MTKKWLVEPKERLRRLILCLYALEILTVIFSAGEKILTYFGLTYHGGVEANPIQRFLMQQIGIIPAIIIGFLFSLLPIVVINYGIKRFKLNSEIHYWIWVVIMTVYFTLFFKVFEHNLSFFW